LAVVEGFERQEVMAWRQARFYTPDQLAGGFGSLYDEFVTGEIGSAERLQNLDEKDSRRDKGGNTR
jgi:hypothetical protein